jgi:predicted MarR family transcription regulator
MKKKHSESASTQDGGARRNIVTSSHLVSEKSAELSEFEFGLNIAANAYNRWIVRCMAAAGIKDMTTTDVLVLHHVFHRERPKKLADICFILNVEDTHVVSYALKKLIAMKLVTSERNGKEVLFSATPKGGQICRRYREVREACLLPGLSGDKSENARLGELAQLLRTVSGFYDQAARAAASL